MSHLHKYGQKGNIYYPVIKINIDLPFAFRIYHIKEI